MQVNVQEGRETKASVLIVDDEEAVAAVLARGLAHAGYETAVAYSGEEALLRLAERSFDVLLTDIHMPRMRGDDLQRIARERYPDLAVLLITAAQDIACAVECMKEGVYDYMTKPFDLSDVAVRVGKALERRRLTVLHREHQLLLEQRVEEQAERIRGMFRHSLEVLNQALEAKDECTRNHSVRVADLAVAIAERLCPDDMQFIARLRVAALLHDIGKIGVPEAILNKPGKLDDSERAFIRRHPIIGETILRPLFGGDAEMMAIVRHHHEYWNGAGYPDGLVGENTPFGARIMAVADAYDAMTSVRPYRPPMSPARALRILREGAGTQWSAVVVNTFLSLAEEGLLPEGNGGEALPLETPKAQPRPEEAPPLTEDLPVVYLGGELDEQAADRLCREAGALVSTGETSLIVDMRRAGRPHRGGIERLRHLQKQIEHAGGCLTLRYVPRVIRVALDAAELAETFQPEPSA